MPLTPLQLAHAQKLNEIYRLKLYWPSPTTFSAAGIPADDPGSPEFARGVEAYQIKNGLAADGICGPKTAQLLTTKKQWKPEDNASSGLVYNGKITPVPGVRILSFQETKLGFDAKHGRVTPRTEKPVMGVLHTTGGEGSGHQVWQTLVARVLSVDCLIDANGDVYQYTDPGKVYTSHGGWTNAISWGFEMTNDLVPGQGRTRPVVRGTLGGQPHTFDGLLPEQAASAVPMVKTYCDLFGIPHQIPGRNGKPLDAPAVPQALVDAFRKARREKRTADVNKISKQAEGIMRPLYEGCVVGHCMTSLGGKPDPSPDVFQYLLDAGFTIKEIP